MVGLIAAALVALAADSGTLANPDLDELSGLTFSRADPGVLWGHNDTGGGAFLYRFDSKGGDLGRAWVPFAQSDDWEAIAAFEDAGGPALLIADTGDNFQWRAMSTLYAVRDPGRTGDVKMLWRLDFAFADGPRDCEAVAVDPVAREILLLTKRDRPSRLYRLPLPERAPDGRQVAEFVGEIAPQPPVTRQERWQSPLQGAFLHSPTGFDISRDGLTAAVVTLNEAYVYRRRQGQGWLEVLQKKVPRIPLPKLPQIESGALSPDGQWLYVGSEKTPARWARIKLPR